MPQAAAQIRQKDFCSIARSGAVSMLRALYAAGPSEPVQAAMTNNFS
jgi:hypothetical protein